MTLPFRRWIREPFVHFVALGGLLFALHAFVAGPGPASADKTIRITEGDVRRLSAAWELQWRRPPTSEELTNLLREHLREEILYREALALGLDRDDSIVRRRLAQKMEFLSEDTAAEQQPTESQLRQFYEAHAGRFRQPAAATFTHLYFSPDQRGESAQSDALRALAQLQAGEPARGDPFMLELRYSDRNAEQIASLFGPAFANAVLSLPVGPWHGPVQSGYGLHVVRIESRTDAAALSFVEAKADVRAAWLEQAGVEANELLYQRLRRGYSIEKDPSLSEIALGTLE